ncbi:hypothetical protein HYW29_01525, partial [Candidatus Amesbacteria bacterium]|nr:hypothetical protein [Candidatus Amesbacteria bacterium]
GDKLHIYASGVTTGVKLERGNNANQATVYYTPAGALSASNVQWAQGMYGSSNDYRLWYYNGSSDTQALAINNNGNVGIGTTNPLQKLHVEGNCVVGDTLLPIRRKRKKKFSDPDRSEDEFDYLFCRIDEVLADDEVLSLNEATQALEYARINRRMDMGIQDVFEITTKSGRRIQVTGNHPFLAQAKELYEISN